MIQESHGHMVKGLRTAAVFLAVCSHSQPIADDSATEIEGAIFAVSPAPCVKYFDPDASVCTYVTYLGVVEK